MSDILRSELGMDTQHSTTLRDRLQAKLAAKKSGVNPDSALLLDISYSMVGNPIDKLRHVASQFKGVRRVEFSDTARELAFTEQISDVMGGTNMVEAFSYCKNKGIKHVVLVTDGEPNPGSERMALRESTGLKIDIFYIGPDPAPKFLRDLANYTGGSYGKASIDLVKELENKIRALLPAPKGAIEL